MNVNEIDWQHSFTNAILVAITDGLQAVTANSPDGLEQAEYCEELVGIAFVALQRYLSSADSSFRQVIPVVLETDYELRRQNCPKVSGVSIVEGIWAAANYWKHHEAWVNWDPDGSGRHTVPVLKRLGVTRETESPCLALLKRLTRNDTGLLTELLASASSWRESVFNRLHSHAPE